MCVCPALVTSSGSLMTWILSHPWDYGVEPREGFQGPWICGDNRSKVKCTTLLSAHMRGLLDQRHKIRDTMGFKHKPSCLTIVPMFQSVSPLHVSEAWLSSIHAPTSFWMPPSQFLRKEVLALKKHLQPFSWLWAWGARQPNNCQARSVFET